MVIRSCYKHTAPLGLNAPMECFSCSTFDTTLRSAGVRGLASSRFYRHIARLERKTGESLATATPQSRGLGFQARWVGKPNPYAFNFSLPIFTFHANTCRPSGALVFGYPVRYKHAAPLGLNAPMECFSCSTFNTTLRSARVRGLASSRFYRHIARLERKTGESFTTATPQQPDGLGNPTPTHLIVGTSVRYKHAAPLGLNAKTG